MPTTLSNPAPAFRRSNPHGIDSRQIAADCRRTRQVRHCRFSPAIFQCPARIAAITASELLHGVERAQDAGRKARRRRHVEQILAAVLVQSFDLAQARVHARIWAELQARGQMIGPHDLLIAAAGLALGHEVATLNVQEFRRVTGLKMVDATSFQRV
ncbi:MAG TPA: PIN domain-containing protein [Candidatus Paceibacterota bacterium]|nr:PIN domain-containing protein [Candidatus Paceibacterota bacterium]